MSDLKSPPQPQGAFIFFADVSQSTVLYDRLGDEAAAGLMMLCLEHATARVLANQGRPIETRGDEILCLFETAEDVLSTANELHELAAEDARLREHRVAFRIGVHHGPVIEHQGALYGDAVNVAARLANQAKAQQTVLSQEVASQFPRDLGEKVRPLGATSVRGKQGMQEMFELLTQSATAEITEVSGLEPSRQRAFLLTLRQHNHQVRLTPMLVRHLMGRGAECDLRIDHPSVSRHHAEICFRNGRFVFKDMSTNGSRVRTANREVIVHRNEVQLPAEGTIVLGRTGTIPLLQIRFVTDELA